MAYEFQGNPLFYRHWSRPLDARPYATNDDVINHNRPALPDEDADFKLPPTFNANVFYTKVQHCRYLCGACGENVLEQNLTEHNSTEHPGTPFIIEMYELFEIDERYACEFCASEQFEADLTKHLTECHRQELINHYYASAYSTPSPQLSPQPLMSLVPFIDAELDNRPIAGTEVMKVPGHFICLACGVSNIREKNLQKHRKKLHANIPQRVNIFSQQPDRPKFKCDVCAKWLFEKNVEKHCRKYHPDKYGGGKHPFNIDATAAAATGGPSTAIAKPTSDVSTSTADDFLNVRISISEFQRLQSQNRIYERNGVKYLKDSE